VSGLQFVATYYQHFGLNGPPFDGGSLFKTPFAGTPQRQAYAELELGMAQALGGFTLLVGESGVGKSTLVKDFLAHHPQHLSESAQRAVIVVDEAEELTDENLNDLQQLADFEAKDEKRLHFLLVARPELLERLRGPALRSIYENIGVRATLAPLSLNETYSYVEYWMRRQGGSAQKIFDRRALHRLAAESAGIPRRINILCDRAMRAAHDRGAQTITMADARSAVATYRSLRASPRTSSGGFVRTSRPLGTTRTVIAAAGALVAAAAVMMFLAQTAGSRGPLVPSQRLIPSDSILNEASTILRPATFTRDAISRFSVPPNLEPTTLRDYAAPIADAQPSPSIGAVPEGYGVGRSDTPKQQTDADVELTAEPGRAPPVARRRKDVKPVSRDTSPALTVAARSAVKHYERLGRRESLQEIYPDEAREEAKPPQPDKTAGEARIQSLDPNWWVVPSSH
jgi:type II secretory pathway predicted ATPase ExeA